MMIRETCDAKGRPQMKRTMKWQGLFLSSLLLLGGMSMLDAQAELYTWTDEQGNVHLSETPPSGKKAKKFSDDKACTIREHLPELTDREFNDFIAKMYNEPPERETLRGRYRNLFDEAMKQSAACNLGDKEACDCLRGQTKMGGTSYAPSHPRTGR
jgi:uncharacterized protein YceH (UPF0502 family)